MFSLSLGAFEFFQLYLEIFQLPTFEYKTVELHACPQYSFCHQDIKIVTNISHQYYLTDFENVPIKPSFDRICRNSIFGS